MVKNKKNKKKINKINKNNKNVKNMELIKKRLIGSRFRYINEKLYKNNSEMSWKLFNNDPKLYTIYHEGYRNQIIKWPYNPINKIISWLNKHKEYFNIGDFGCGDALIAKTFKKYSVTVLATAAPIKTT
ncbi:uncharacterized protein TA03880 [Theileria annulata]|uniref:Ribosomal RNA-processing protein 8 n=1 Tax=Theileria annulata TaxID=5874 RepID=Q4UCC8_THEAN|nr:uncharacterized protein TA03880 [Theileria annulata]CAI75523.1 hypothetical protein, conserved [Theileria annulata]|eukprot:XP_954999.1 hypothetical protein, conserved [Theileria annulata]